MSWLYIHLDLAYQTKECPESEEKFLPVLGTLWKNEIQKKLPQKK